jgi:N-acetylneuraminic acid mutarotase
VGAHPGPHTDACFVYDHAEMPGKQWKSLPPLPIGRAGGGMHYIKSRNAIFFAGGAIEDGKFVDFPDSWLLPLDGSSGWQKMKDMPFLANHMGYVTARDNVGAEHYYFLGGQLSGNEATGNIDTNYEYDAASNVWIERQKMIFPRGHATSSALAISCGFIIVAGTTNGTGHTKEIHYYDIPSNTWTKIGDNFFGVNSPVCAIANGFLTCETGWSDGFFSSRVRIEV